MKDKIRALTFTVDAYWMNDEPQHVQDLKAELKPLFAAVTIAKNRIMTELYVTDVRRPTDSTVGTKMPRHPKTPAMSYAYQVLSGCGFGKGNSASQSSISKSTAELYAKKRYDIIWTGTSSLPTYRYPQPYPFTSVSWSYEIKDSRVYVQFRISGRNWKLRMKGGPGYRKFLIALKTMIKQSELVLSISKKGQLRAKVVGTFPVRATKSIEDATLYVRTDKDRILVAETLTGEVGKIGIYSITGPTGKIYYGQSINMGGRWTAHKADLQAATKNPKDAYYNDDMIRDVAMYGITEFKWAIVEETLQLDARELYWIDKHSTHVTGYNNQSEHQRLIDKDPVHYRGLKRQQWTENGDHILRLMSAHKRQVRRMSEDTKAELKASRGLKLAKAKRAAKYNARMNSLIDEIAAHLINYAIRYGYRRIYYSDSIKWLENFRYFELAMKIEQKCMANGLEFVPHKDASGLTGKKDAEVLAESVSSVVA